MTEQVYEITEEILKEIEVRSGNYSLLARSLVAEIRRLQGDVAAHAEASYDNYLAAQERAFNDSLNQMEDEREAQEYFEEHGVEPGGTCPNCGRTDAGCICDQYDGFDNPYTSRFQEYEPPSDW